MIILRRKKKIVELFPIGSSKGALNHRRKPFFYAYIKFRRVEGQVKISKFIVKKDKELVLPPSEAVKILRKQNVFLVGSDHETEEFLDSLNIKYKHTLICRHCTFEGFITLIQKEKSYMFHGDYLCRLCAENEIKRELKSRSYDMSTFPRFRKMLDETGNLAKVLSIFDPRFDPLKNQELTLFDKITTRRQDNLPEIFIDELKIPEDLKKSLKSQGTHLLPVQVLALQAGVLEGESLLVVSATASGKTLIGELAGIPKALEGGKFLFLTPLVALANQKYRDFKKRYQKMGLNVSLRVGMSRIKAKEELNLPEDDIGMSDIVVGTYEGIDFLLRAGRSSQLGNLKVVVVDEIHMMGDEDRGPRLRGLIRRLKTIFPDLQVIGLSATVKNPEEIASEFDMKLVEYPLRPVPLERHLIFVGTEEEKNHLMTQLSRMEYQNRSKKGYHGQSIIFTNSRRKTHIIADFLIRRGIKAAAYHAGLSYAKKNRIEKDFGKQKLAAVVTTAALAAGVDFPASQVLFESLTMGNQTLTPNEFSQMLGRAGRPTYHDQGKVYLLPEVGRSYGDETEETQAMKLLASDVEKVNVTYSEDSQVEQFLADVCAGCVERFPQIITNYRDKELPLEFEDAFNIMIDYGLVKEKQGNIKPTAYGRAVSISFLAYPCAEYIRQNLGRMKPLDIALKLEPFENAYLSNRITTQIGRILKINMSTRLFADSTLDILSSSSAISKLEPNLRERLIKLQMDFYTCKCKERPFCGCFQRELSRKMVQQRLKHRDPVDISKKLMRDYEIHAYAGDIFSWLDSLIRMLEAVRRIANAYSNKKVVHECNRLVREIEN
ncbi:MAG: DEAD/DEAH box helicase [Methanobacteriaceae archaeon]|nr:DEAD/DEAH box helicase [Methanobacteriaceae archaeon]